MLLLLGVARSLLLLLASLSTLVASACLMRLPSSKDQVEAKVEALAERLTPKVASMAAFVTSGLTVAQVPVVCTEYS